MNGFMRRQFVETIIFTKRWKGLGLTDDDLCELEHYIMDNPDAGNIIEGTGGAIKLRYSLANKGKSGGLRVIYVDFMRHEKIYLITAYPKSQKDTLTDSEKLMVKETIKRLAKNERGGLQ